MAFLLLKCMATTYQKPRSSMGVSGQGLIIEVVEVCTFEDSQFQRLWRQKSLRHTQRNPILSHTKRFAVTCVRGAMLVCDNETGYLPGNL